MARVNEIKANLDAVEAKIKSLRKRLDDGSITPENYNPRIINNSIGKELGLHQPASTLSLNVPDMQDIRKAFKQIEEALEAKKIYIEDADRLRLVASIDPSAVDWALKDKKPDTASAFLLGQMIGAGKIKVADFAAKAISEQPSFY